MSLELSAATWRKSSHSGGNGGNCVEMAFTEGATAVRDSKLGSESPVLAFPATAVTKFIAAAKVGEFDGV
jgi:hypothetical protein